MTNKPDKPVDPLAEASAARGSAERDRLEIQRAHDILVAVKLGDVPHPMPEDDRLLTAALDVLCWVLKHEHNQSFAQSLADIEAQIESAGFRLGSSTRSEGENYE